MEKRALNVRDILFSMGKIIWTRDDAGGSNLAAKKTTECTVLLFKKNLKSYRDPAGLLQAPVPPPYFLSIALFLEMAQISIS